MSFADQQGELRYQRASDVVEVFLVEDHGLFRDGLSELLTASDPALRIVGTAATAEDALVRLPELVPDVVLMDIHLPGMTGTDAIRQLAVTCPSVTVLVISGSAEDRDVMEAILAGARGYILKTARVEEITAGIHAAAEGGSILSPLVASQLLDHVRDNASSLRVGAAAVGQLTPRELEVLRLMAQGLENSEIARELVISTRTARNHVASILEKLQMQNRIQAAVYAVRHGVA
jgi:two-component system, NarL family, nitrate/nitrite response regulator NarL